MERETATVDGLLTRKSRSDRPSLVDGSGRSYDRHWVCTTAWKAGNFLRHTGVRRGVTVGVGGGGPLAILSFLGTALLEGRTWFDPPESLDGGSSVRTLVAPADELDRYDLSAGAQRVAYGGEPPAPEVHHLDAGLWSENPSFPPVDIDPGAPLVGPTDRDDASVTHGEAMNSARTVVEEWGVEAGTHVGVDAPLSDPRTVVAGVLAPLVADGVIVLDPVRTETPVDVVVTDRPDDFGADRRVSLDSVRIDVD
ncbi:hypothetical protein [Halovivax gelatinilyticus]|uniref:hypothetical protein n=1 Tax=Halovivax gelatinilyticus TaxID=2961597 RepID=UPI0020CA8EE9|nr:hypothetical protein [Halovivax gelatinilyticus]